MRKLLASCRIFVLSAKSSIITAGLLILLASFCLNMLSILTIDYTKNFDRIREELNGEDNAFVFTAPDIEELKSRIAEELDSRKQVDAYEITDTKWFWGGCKYGNGEMQSFILPISKSAAVNKRIGRCRIISSDPEIKGVYLPYSFYVSGNYHTGDDFTVTDNLQSKSAKVAGFYYSATHNTQNCYAVYLIYDDEIYEDISQTFAASAAVVSVKLKDPAYAAEIEKELPSKIETSAAGASLIEQNRFQTVKTARYVTTLIASAAIGVAAIVFLIVTLVGLNVYISNYVRDREKDIGILKTLGYTDDLIVRPIIAFFILLAVICSLLGTMLFYAVFPYLNSIFEEQVGLPYPVRFVPSLSAGTMLIVLLDAYIVVRLTLNRVKKVTPINAINQSRTVPKVKKQRFSLEKSELPLNLSLAVIGMKARRRQTIVVIITMFAVAYNLVFMIVQLNTAAMSSDEIVGVLLGESCDVSAVTLSSERENFEKELAGNEAISGFVSYDVLSCDHVGGDRLHALIIGDGDKLNNKATYYEGSYPRNEYQVAVGGKYAVEHHIEIGDTIELSLEGSSAEYEVCGFNQSVRYLGTDCSFTLKGFERIKKTVTNQYYINLKPGVDRDRFIEDLRGSRYTLNVSDVRAYRIGTIEPYSKVINTIAMLLALISLFVMMFVIINMTSYILKAKEQSYGILKAMGLTSKDLLIQTVLEISVPVTAAAVIGIVLSYFTIGRMMELFVYRVGMMKSCFEAPLLWTVLAGAGLILIVPVIVSVLSLRIKTLSPKKLLGGM